MLATGGVLVFISNQSLVTALNINTHATVSHLLIAVIVKHAQRPAVHNALGKIATSAIIQSARSALPQIAHHMDVTVGMDVLDMV